ncbi:MAG: dihydroorotase [Deltaproteobacteria bacterium]|nr:dihydroorotase [Deltaproteobacteria bacterium]
MRTLSIPRPDDWHCHFRDGATMRSVLPLSADFGRVIAMPNLVPPVDTAAAGAAYRDRLLASVPPGSALEPLVVAYLTDDTDPDDLEAGFQAGTFVGAKWYPAKATTNAAHGVTHVDRIRAVLERMAELGMPLLVHGEVTDADVDVFDRERVFLETVLGPLLERIPALRCVVEHATTREAVAFVEAHENAAATITPHHLWWNRNALFQGGLRPHAYCLPVLKREADRQALRRAATSGDPRFFGGTDSAPHPVHRKEMDCGCAGVFCAPTAIAAYVQVFDEEGQLDRLAGFLSEHGAAFYGRQVASERLELVERSWTPPLTVALKEGGEVRVFLGGETLRWSIA